MKRKTPDQWFALSVVVLILMFFAFSFLTSCAAFQRGPDGAPSDAERVAAAAAPLLPPPFGIIAGAIATAASTVAGVAANRQVAKVGASNVSPLVALMTTHNWILPAIGVLVSVGRANGWLHIGDGELALLWSALGAPEAAEQWPKVAAMLTKPAPSNPPTTP